MGFCQLEAPQECLPPVQPRTPEAPPARPCCACKAAESAHRSASEFPCPPASAARSATKLATSSAQINRLLPLPLSGKYSYYCKVVLTTQHQNYCKLLLQHYPFVCKRELRAQSSALVRQSSLGPSAASVGKLLVKTTSNLLAALSTKKMGIDCNPKPSESTTFGRIQWRMRGRQKAVRRMCRRIRRVERRTADRPANLTADQAAVRP